MDFYYTNRYGTLIGLSEDTALRMEITEEDKKEIIRLHELRERVFTEMENTFVPEELKMWATVVEKIEFLLQDAWNFERDRSTHSWWHQVPHCTCRKFSQSHPFDRFTADDCPVHNGLT